MAHLKLVSPQMSANNVVGQLPLFVDSPPTPNLCVVSTAALDGAGFLRIVDHIRPGAVFDLRPVPRFNFSGTSRRKVLAAFQDRECAYVDLTGLVGILSSRDARLNPEEVASLIVGRFESLAGRHHRAAALMLLFDNEHLAAVSARQLPSLLRPIPKGGWRVALTGVPRLRTV